MCACSASIASPRTVSCHRTRRTARQGAGFDKTALVGAALVGAALAGDPLVGLGLPSLAADSVAPGGLLVYSTCTLEPEENAERVDDFLATRPDFAPEPSTTSASRHVDARGMLVVTPQATGFDGAFAARLRRVA